MPLPDLLRALATFRRDEQPEWFSHVYPHGRATARLARAFAAAYGKVLRGPTLDEIEFGAQVHDIGKYLISKAILFKPGPLAREEQEIISHHSVYGAQIICNLSYVTTHVNQIVLYHHERWDGLGYPDGIAGHSIPLAARIVSIADVYTTLLARRSYKPAFTQREVCATLVTMAGHELDPNLVHDFLRFVGRDVEVRCA